MKISMSKYYYNKDYFSKIDTPDKAYWLGFLYADGCITRYYKNDQLSSMSLEITLCDADRNHLQKFLDCLESNISIRDKVTKLNGTEYKSCKVAVNCTKMCYDLIALGCTPKKTYDLKFPSYDIVPKYLMRDFLRGFFDGDGCISVTEMSGKPHIVLTITGMSDMLQSISDFLLSENIIRVIPKIYDDKRSKASSLRLYGKDSNKEVLDYLYQDSIMYLDRKIKLYQEFYKDYQLIEKRGVHWHKENQAYVVTICINGKHERVGQYKNLEDAIQARKEAEIKKMNIENAH